MQQMQQGRQQQPQREGNFNAATRQTIVQQPDQVWPGSAAQITRLDLPQTGFFSGIWLLLQGSIVTASASSGAAEDYPLTPYSLIRKIRIYNNQNVELWNTSGYGAYIYQRTLRTAFDTFGTINEAVPAAARFGNVTNPLAQYYKEVANLGASATGTFRGGLYLPVVWGFPQEHGLQLAQDPAIRYSMEITWGDLTDLMPTSGQSGTVTLQTSTKCSVACELFQVPEEGIDFPNMAFTKTVLEDIQALSAGTGDNTYNFVTGNVLTRMIHECSNIVSSNRQPIDPTAFSNFQLQYAQVQKPYVINPDIQLLRQRVLYGSDLPPGVLVHELQTGLGLPEMPTTRDVLNTSRLTDLQSIITLSGVTLSTGQLRTIRCQLSANR